MDQSDIAATLLEIKTAIIKMEHQLSGIAKDIDFGDRSSQQLVKNLQYEYNKFVRDTEKDLENVWVAITDNRKAVTQLTTDKAKIMGWAAGMGTAAGGLGAALARLFGG